MVCQKLNLLSSNSLNLLKKITNDEESELEENEEEEVKNIVELKTTESTPYPYPHIALKKLLKKNCVTNNVIKEVMDSNKISYETFNCVKAHEGLLLLRPLLPNVNFLFILFGFCV